MNRPNKPKVRVLVSYVFPEKATPGKFQVTLEQVKKYTSSKPLFRPPRRKKEP